MLFSALFRKNISLCDDSELVELVRKGNKRAHGELFKRYSALVMGVCLKYLKDYPRAEDMMMSVFERLPKKIGTHEINAFKSWLYGVTRNECLMLLRKKNKETGTIDTTLITTEDTATEELNLALLKEEKLTALETALKKLKPEQENALRYFYLERKCYDEVATLMKIPLKKVKSLIQNGKRNLKLILENKDVFQQ